MAVWETLDSRTLWQSRWYNLRQDRLRTPAGHEFSYTLVDHPGAVWVVPVTDDGQVDAETYCWLCWSSPALGLTVTEWLPTVPLEVRSGRQPLEAAGVTLTEHHGQRPVLSRKDPALTVVAEEIGLIVRDLMLAAPDLQRRARGPAPEESRP